MMQGPEAVVALVFFGSVGITAITLARGYAKRLAGGSVSAAELEAMKDEMAELRTEVEEMRARVADLDELQNRLDFTERVIGQMKNKPVLPGGGH